MHSKAKIQEKKVPKLRFSGFSDAWKVFKLKETNKIYDGTHQTPNYVREGVPFYSVEQLTADNFSDTKYIDRSVYEVEKRRTHIEKDDILMTRIGDIGTARLIDWDAEASFYVSLALIKKSRNIDSVYLSKYIGANHFQHELWRRTIHVAFPKKINLGEIGECPVSRPSLDEQQKIASFLTAVDNWIDNLKNQKEALEKYKKGMMQKIFSQEIRFKDENGNDYPKWEERRLAQITHIASGVSKSSFIEAEGKYVIVDMGGISSTGRLIAKKRTNFSSDFLTTDDLVMPKDDIGGGLIIGAVARIPRNNSYILGDHVFKLTPKDGIVGFMYYTINSFDIRKSLRRKANGTAQLGLSKKDVEKQVVKIPSKSEQEKIADFLASLDNRIWVMQEALIRGELWKKGLMQNLFI